MFATVCNEKCIYEYNIPSDAKSKISIRFNARGGTCNDDELSLLCDCSNARNVLAYKDVRELPVFTMINRHADNIRVVTKSR